MAQVTKKDVRAFYPDLTRKSPALLGIRIVALVFVLQLGYIVFRVLFPTSLLAGSLSLYGTLLLIQLAVAVFLTVAWYVETYELHGDEVAHKKGILFRREYLYPYNNIQTITLNQGPLGRIFHFGTVSLFIPTLGRDLDFTEVPHPHHFTQRIKYSLPYPDRARFIMHG